MQNSLIDVLSREVGSTYNKNKDRSFSRTETEKARNFDERMRNEEFIKNKEIALLNDSLRNASADANFARQLIENNRRDSVKSAERFAEFENLLKNQQQQAENNRAFDEQKYNQRAKTDSIRYANRLQEARNERDEVENKALEKERRLYTSYAGSARRLLQPFLTEEDGLLNLGLNESEMYNNFYQNFDVLNQLVTDIDSKKIPKSNPERQKTERLLIDLHDKIRSFDYKKGKSFSPQPRQVLSPNEEGVMPRGEWEDYNDFMDGGFGLEDSRFSNSSEIQDAQAVYDDLTTMMLRLGIPIPKKSIGGTR